MSKKRLSKSSSKSKPKRNNGEGSVYWDSPRGKYAASIFDVNGKRQRAFFDNEDQAHEWRTAQKIARMKGEATFVRDPKASLSDYLNDWLSSKTHLTPNGYRCYSQAIKNRIEPFIGHVRLKNLNPKVIEDFLKKLQYEKHYKGGTIRGVIRTLNAAFEDGVRWGELPANPMKRVEPPKLVSVPSPRIPRDDLVKLRIQASQNPLDKALLQVGSAIGLRPGEIAGLKWKDFNPWEQTLVCVRQIQRVRGKGLIECPPKTLRKKPIPLILEEVALFCELQEYRFGDEDMNQYSEQYIFPNAKGGPLDRNQLRKWFRKLCADAGVPRFELYQMRKTAFTELSQVTDLATVKAYSGHTQITTLEQHYIDPDMSAVKEALEKRSAARKSYFPIL
jgi:integrase